MIFLLNILTITDKVVRVCKIILCENRFVLDVNYGLYSIRQHFRTFLSEERDEMVMKFLSTVFSLLERCLCVVPTKSETQDDFMDEVLFVQSPLESEICQATKGVVRVVI